MLVVNILSAKLSKIQGWPNNRDWKSYGCQHVEPSLLNMISCHERERGREREGCKDVLDGGQNNEEVRDFVSEIVLTMKNRKYMRVMKSEWEIERELYPSWRRSRHHFFPSLFGRYNIEQICQFTSQDWPLWFTPVCITLQSTHLVHRQYDSSSAVVSTTGCSLYKFWLPLSPFCESYNGACYRECKLMGLDKLANCWERVWQEMVRCWHRTLPTYVDTPSMDKFSLFSIKDLYVSSIWC